MEFVLGVSVKSLDFFGLKRSSGVVRTGPETLSHLLFLVVCVFVFDA